MNAVIDAVTKRVLEDVLEKGIFPLGLLVVIFGLVIVYMWIEIKAERKRNRELQERRIDDLNTAFVKVMTAVETLQAGLEFVKRRRQ